MTLKAPKMLAGPAEAGLDLVGNEQAACPLDRVDSAPQKARWFGRMPSLVNNESTISAAGLMP